MYYIGICDDDPAFIGYMKRLFGMVCDEVTFYEYLSGEELVQDMEQREMYDLLILDVWMPGMDGNETARNFRKQFPDTVLVFCSGVCMPTVETFETTPYRYWLKKYTEARMCKEVKTVMEKVKQNKSTPQLFGKKDNMIHRISAKIISYISVAKVGTVIHCGTDTYTSAKKLAEHYEVLKECGFVYAHNSYIVNLKYVVMAGVKELQLLDGERLSVSRSRSKEFQKAFALEMGKKYAEENV